MDFAAVYSMYFKWIRGPKRPYPVTRPTPQWHGCQNQPVDQVLALRWGSTIGQQTGSIRPP
jgi:hypothetical protein